MAPKVCRHLQAPRSPSCSQTPEEQAAALDPVPPWCQRHMEALSLHPSRFQALLISVPFTAVTRQNETPLSALFFRASQSQMKPGWAWMREHPLKKHSDFTSKPSNVQPAASLTHHYSQLACGARRLHAMPRCAGRTPGSGSGAALTRDASGSSAAPSQLVTPSKDGDGRSCRLHQPNKKQLLRWDFISLGLEPLHMVESR